MADPNYHTPDVEDGDAPEKPSQPNAADRKSVRAQEKAVKARNDAIDAGLSTCLETAHGRYFLAWLLFELANVNSRIETPLFDTNAVHFFAGRRQVGLDIQDRALRLSRDRYMLLLSEHFK